MTRKRAWEIGAAVLLVMVVCTAGVGSFARWRRLQDLNRALASALDADRRPEMLRLLQAGADARLRGRDGLTVLAAAAASGDVPLLREALRHGADVDDSEEGGSTALALAASCGEVEAVRTLLSLGADVNAANDRGETAIWAVRSLPYSDRRADRILVLLRRAGARE